MRKQPVLYVVLCFPLVSIAIAGRAAIESRQLSGARNDNVSAVHLIIAIQGGVSVKRQGWREYAPARFGTRLRIGDLLRLETSSQAKVVCADLTVHDVTARGSSAVPCSASPPVLRIGGSLVDWTRGSASSEFPLIVSPRMTRLLTLRPTLRWTAVAGATSYQVSVRGSNVDWTSPAVSGTSIVYPDDAPALSPGTTYKVTVVARGRSSDEEGLAGLGFTLLNRDETEAVRQEEKRILGLGLDDARARYLLAHLYASRELIAEAAESLEQLTGSLKEPAVWRSLGDFYLTIGLVRLADNRYHQALELSQKAKDVEGQGLAQLALGLINDEALGNRREASERLRQAIRLYRALGDAETVRQIEERVAKQ